MELDGLALDELRLERLDAEAVQVGARFSSTGRSRMISSSTSHTCGRERSTMRFAALMFCAWLRSIRRLMTNGLKSSSAICLGRPHWCSFSCGPTTMTERPE